MSPKSRKLTGEEQQHYETQGYHVEKALVSPDEVAELLAEMDRAIRGELPESDRIALQEEPALAGRQAGLPPEQKVFRKIEGLVHHAPAYHELACDPRVLDIIESVIGPDIKVFRDALMKKPPFHGSAKPYHQDSAYWPIEPMNLVSMWLALDDATVENGCMRVVPGSHQQGIVEHKSLEDYQVEDDAVDLDREVALEMQAGDALFFHSLLLHATSPNISDRPRRAMIISYMSAQSRYTQDPGSKPDFLLVRGREYAGAV